MCFLIPPEAHSGYPRVGSEGSTDRDISVNLGGDTSHPVREEAGGEHVGGDGDPARTAGEDRAEALTGA